MEYLLLAVLWIIWCAIHSGVISLTATDSAKRWLGPHFRFYRLCFNLLAMTEIFRQAAESQIITAAYAINQGRMPNLKTPEGRGDFYFIEADEPEAIRDVIVRLVKERIPTRFGFDPKADIHVLSPRNRSLLGSLNDFSTPILPPRQGLR